MTNTSKNANMIVFTFVSCLRCFKFLIFFVVRSFGRQGRFNAVDIIKWRIAITLKVEWFRAGEEQDFGQRWFRREMHGMAMSCMGALPKPQRHDPQYVWWKQAWRLQWLGYFVKSVPLDRCCYNTKYNINTSNSSNTSWQALLIFMEDCLCWNILL